MIFGLLPLLVIVGLAALAVRALSRRDAARRGAAGAVSVRHFFQYALMFGVLIVVAIGLTGLIEQILPAEGTEISTDEVALARSLAFVIVGGPVLFGLAAWTRRTLGQPGDPERDSFAWSAYLTVASITALSTSAWAMMSVTEWALQARDYDPAAVAMLIVWAPVWFGHWRLMETHANAERLQVERFVAAGIGLALLASALVQTVGEVFETVYRQFTEADVLARSATEPGTLAALFVVGGAIWWWYWMRYGLTAPESRWRQAYLLLFGVLSGLAAAIGSGAVVLYELLVWLVGDPDTTSPARHFSEVPGLLAVVVVGLVVWAYHRSVLASERREVRSEIDRVYDYLLAAVGLVAASTGITMLLVAAFEAIAPADAVVVGDTARNTLLAAVTSLAVGLPVWWVFWRNITRERGIDPVEEIDSPTRRVYLFSLFGVGGVVALVSMLTLVFVFIEDVLTSELSSETLYDVRVAVALVIAMGAIAAYHWLVYREDRELAPAKEELTVREIVLVGATENGWSHDLEKALGVHVLVWRRLDEPATEIDHDAAIEAIRRAEHERVMLLAHDGTFDVVPYEAV
jgi:hypothetical protein